MSSVRTALMEAFAQLRLDDDFAYNNVINEADSYANLCHGLDFAAGLDVVDTCLDSRVELGESLGGLGPREEDAIADVRAVVKSLRENH